MNEKLPDQDNVLAAIRETAAQLGRPPSRAEFKGKTGMTEYQVLRYFPSWNEALKAAGLEPYSSNVAIEPNVLLEDWGEFVRKSRRIPTRHQYRQEGTYSPGVFEKKFGPWSRIPSKFKEFAADRSEWSDVVALLPTEHIRLNESTAFTSTRQQQVPSGQRYSKLDGRPTYGNPIDFRGLRHEPVNEGGVVFLFGMVSRELGYLVEAIQAGFPDCEAKRQVEAGKWQRVRIEFEYESRNFRDHGHQPEGCDVIVCWIHNWPECPDHLEVVELSEVIRQLSSSEE